MMIKQKLGFDSYQMNKKKYILSKIKAHNIVVVIILFITIGKLNAF